MRFSGQCLLCAYVVSNTLPRREIVGWEETPSGGKKPILEPSKDWLGLLRWGAK